MRWRLDPEKESTIVRFEDFPNFIFSIPCFRIQPQILHHLHPQPQGENPQQINKQKTKQTRNFFRDQWRHVDVGAELVCETVVFGGFIHPFIYSFQKYYGESTVCQAPKHTMNKTDIALLWNTGNPPISHWEKTRIFLGPLWLLVAQWWEMGIWGQVRGIVCCGEVWGTVKEKARKPNSLPHPSLLPCFGRWHLTDGGKKDAE